MKVFQYLCFLDSSESPKVVVDVTTVVAKDLKAAELMAARSIPKKYEDQLNDIKVIVRPFDTNPTHYTYYYGYSYPYYYGYSGLNSYGSAGVAASGSYSYNTSSVVGSGSSVNNTTTAQTQDPSYSSVSDILNSAV